MYVASERSAASVIRDLLERQDPSQLPLMRKRLAPDEAVFGMRMRDLSDVAKRHAGLSLSEVAALLDHPAHEPRMAAFCILDFQARKLTDGGHAALADCYLQHHDRITTWDVVDRAAPRVVGGPRRRRPE